MKLFTLPTMLCLALMAVALPQGLSCASAQAASKDIHVTAEQNKSHEYSIDMGVWSRPVKGYGGGAVITHNQPIPTPKTASSLVIYQGIQSFQTDGAHTVSLQASGWANVWRPALRAGQRPDSRTRVDGVVTLVITEQADGEYLVRADFNPRDPSAIDNSFPYQFLVPHSAVTFHN